MAATNLCHLREAGEGLRLGRRSGEKNDVMTGHVGQRVRQDDTEPPTLQRVLSTRLPSEECYREVLANEPPSQSHRAVLSQHPLLPYGCSKFISVQNNRR